MLIDLRIFANRMPGRRSTGLFNYIDKTLMADNKRIKTALVSVFHKDGLDELLSLLHNHGVKFLSTGGTKSFIDGLGCECEAVVSHKSSLHSSSGNKRPFGLHIVQSTPILDIPILLKSFRLATRQKTSPVCTCRQI